MEHLSRRFQIAASGRTGTMGAYVGQVVIHNGRFGRSFTSRVEASNFPFAVKLATAAALKEFRRRHGQERVSQVRADLTVVPGVLTKAACEERS
jgi:hypothetical protein